MPGGSIRTTARCGPSSSSSSSSSSGRVVLSARGFRNGLSNSYARPSRDFYSFVSADGVSTIYNAVAAELWRRSFWREIPPDAIGQRLGGAAYRDCDVILAQCHGRGAPFSEIGCSGKVQVLNYLQGSKKMTLKAELALLLREWLETHPHEEPFTPLTYVIYPRKWTSKGPRRGGLSLAARGGRMADEREAFQWESRLRSEQGIGDVWVAKTNHGSKGTGVRVLDGAHRTCDFIDAALQGSSQAVAVQKYVEDPLLILGFKFDMRMWVLVDMEYGVFLYREGVLRLSSSIYDPDNLDDTFSHLTNHCIQTASPYYERLVEGNEMFFDQVRGGCVAGRRRVPSLLSVRLENESAIFLRGHSMRTSWGLDAGLLPRQSLAIEVSIGKLACHVVSTSRLRFKRYIQLATEIQVARLVQLHTLSYTPPFSCLSTSRAWYLKRCSNTW